MWCVSARASGINFQACSIDHSDISPFRINDLRVVRNSLAQNPPSNLAVPRCDLDSVVCWGASSRSSPELCQTFLCAPISYGDLVWVGESVTLIFRSTGP